MRTGWRDHLEIPRLLKRLNEEDEVILSQLCGNYVELPTARRPNRHTIWGDGSLTGVIHQRIYEPRRHSVERAYGVWLMVRGQGGN